MPRGKPMRARNGYGSVVKLSGKRRQPYEVRVNTRMDERYYPVYDVLGRFETREAATIVLADFNKEPYRLSDRNITFSALYELFYWDKYEESGRIYSQSTRDCTRIAYNHSAALHDLIYRDLRTPDFKSILAQKGSKGKPLSHATQEHIKNLFSQMDRFALQNDIIKKGYSTFASITVAEDDTPGVPFTQEEIEMLWNNINVPWVDSILIYIYSGWRISELLLMPPENIDLDAGTFQGGLKIESSKNRIVPIHSKIRAFVEHRLTVNNGILFARNDRPISADTYTKLFKNTLTSVGISTYHTPHDCRHTFISLLDSAGANPVCIDRLVGHASKSITARTYTHKTIAELRKAIEMI